MLPNFLHIGAAKCASTWLWRVYQEHPEVYVPTRRDNVNFFVAEYHKGLDWYEKTFFGAYAGEKAVGETSNSYMVFEPALERIARDLPGVRLTVTLRNPIERAFIHWVHVKQRGLRPDQLMEFEDALHPNRWANFRYWIEPGLYSLHLKKVYRYFSKERLRIMFYDDLVEDPARFLRGFFEFLEVDPDFERSVLNTVVGFPSPDWPDQENLVEEGFSEDLRDELRRIFREDIEALQEVTGRDLSHWRQEVHKILLLIYMKTFVGSIILKIKKT